MPYSIGGNQLQVINGDVNGALSAMGDAYKQMGNGLEGLAKVPYQLKSDLQDNADARYSAALNRYSNDPEGLARALQNGEIDTSMVRANTLNQTQERLKDISVNKTLNYELGQKIKSNDWFNANQALVGRMQDAVHRGDKAEAARIMEEASKAGIDTTNFSTYFMGNPMDQLNKEEDFAIRRQTNAVSAMMPKLYAQKYADEQALKKARVNFINELAVAGYGANSQLRTSPAEFLTNVMRNPNAYKNSTELIKAAQAYMGLGGEVLEPMDTVMKYGDPLTLYGDGANIGQQTPVNKTTPANKWGANYENFSLFN